MTWLFVFGVSLTVAYLATPVIRAVAIRAGILDRPTARSSHAVPTPRLGGLAILLGCAVALGAGMPPDGQLYAILGAGSVMALVGALDDVGTVPPEARLILQIAVGLGLVAGAGMRLPESLVGAGVPALLFSVVWMVGLTNAYNFMDGVNGIAALQAVIGGLTLATLAVAQGDPAAATLSLALAGACAGFMPWNARSGSIFMGDAGSLALGITFAAVMLRLGPRPGALIAATLAFAPFLLDTTATLLRRLWHREHLLSPHRSHYYQRLAALGCSHMEVTATWGSLALIGSAAALAFDRVGVAGGIAIVAGVLAVHVLVALAIEGSERTQSRITNPAGKTAPNDYNAERQRS